MAKRGRKPKTTTTPKVGKAKIQLVKMKDVKVDDSLFTPIKTGHSTLDNFFSTEGGIMPATNIIVVGDPGVGKSTVLLDILANVQITNTKVTPTLRPDGVLTSSKKVGKKVLFISGEMNQIDMVGYCRRYPKFNQIDILFMSDYADYDPTQVIEDTLNEGYDMVLIDSWAEVADTIREFKGWDRRKSEHYMLGLLDRQNKAQNDASKHTCFLIIQQVTKGGDFVGSNRLKHMTTGMMYMRLKGDDRTMYFVKNRRGNVGSVVEFTLLSENVTYGIADVIVEDEAEDIL
jgi:predicted ATP-dependent serine protease